MKNGFCREFWNEWKVVTIAAVFLSLGLVATASQRAYAEAITQAEGATKQSDDAATAKPEEVERFLGLDRVEIFSRQRRLSESGADKKSLNFINLKLDEAIQLTIKTHLKTRESEEKIEASLARRWQAASPLLPHLEFLTSQQRTFRENLQALGFKGTPAIGPFNTFDARFRLIQKIIDLHALANFKAGNIDVTIARSERDLANQKVILIASMAYLDALRAHGAFKAAQASLELSERLLKQAKNQMDTGIATNVDVARARTRVAQDSLRLEKTRKSTYDAYIELQRVTGLPYDSTIQLLNSLCFIEENMPHLNDALVTANNGRIEMKIAQERIHASKFRLYGARAELLPKFEFAGDYGWSGNEPDHGGGTRPTGSAMFRLTMPVLEGGMNYGKIRESASVKRQDEIYFDDLKRQVEEDVYLASWMVETSVEQVNAAGQVVELARQELDLASHRFSEGLGDNVEVVNAQTTLELARNEYIAALTQYHTARINWYFSLGKAESFSLKSSAK